MNWHIEHHMCAGVPCYNLARLHREIKPHLPPTNQGLFATWFQILAILYREANEPGYRYTAELPNGGKVPASPEPKAATAPSTIPSTPTTLPPLSGAARRIWQCSVCAFIYDEAKGLPEEGIAPGTAWADIPDDWSCPDCGVSKKDFRMREIQAPVQSRTNRGPLVVVGGGMASIQLLRELRRLDTQRSLVLVTEDDGEVYSKPGLSNAMARADRDLVQQRAEDLA